MHIQKEEQLTAPTSSLDPISEREVYRLSEHIFQEKTTLFITHRLGAVSQMDEILVLDHGQLVEHGCHEELMRKNGVYRKLYQTQKEMYVDEICLRKKSSGNCQSLQLSF